MAEKLLMLALSPTMETGIIAKWNKAEGDRVASGDVLFEVETDKALMDYESPADGILLKIILKEGSSAAVGDLIGIIGKEGEEIDDLLVEVTDVNQDKAGSDQPEMPQKDQPEAGTPEEAVTVPTETAVDSSHLRTSPLARKLADINGLKLTDIQGSGPKGRIIKADVEQAMAKAAAAPAGDRRKEPAVPVITTSSAQDVVIPVTGKRRVIAKRLAESMYSAPHYYLKVPLEMDEILASRSRLNARPDTKVSLNAYIIKFVAEALKRHPRVNASWTGDTIVEHGRVDIGLAVAQKDGLITPVVRDCGNKGIVQIDEELRVLIEKARSETLTPEEYSGATFTISSLGSYGIEEFTAIINPPGSAILAIGEIKRVPVVQQDDVIQIKSVMKLTLSCDHRVIDGSVGAEFLTELRDMMQEPVRALY